MLAALLLVQTTGRNWELIFRESFDATARRAGLKPLIADRSQGRRELRLWYGFGVTFLKGVRLVREGERWVLEVIRGGDDALGRPLNSRSDERWTPKYATVRRRVGPMTSKWMTTLFSKAPLQLPDGDALPNRVLIFDGFSYVLESRWDGRYRARLYSHPDDATEPEDLRMRRIGALMFGPARKTFAQIELLHPYGRS